MIFSTFLTYILIVINCNNCLSHPINVPIRAKIIYVHFFLVIFRLLAHSISYSVGCQISWKTEKCKEWTWVVVALTGSFCILRLSEWYLVEDFGICLKKLTQIFLCIRVCNFFSTNIRMDE